MKREEQYDGGGKMHAVLQSEIGNWFEVSCRILLFHFVHTRCFDKKCVLTKVLD